MTTFLRNIKRHGELYATALFIGITGYGGLAVVDLIKKEYVAKKKFISEHRFLNALSLSQILPGSSIINLIAYFSYLRAGLIGAIIGTTIYILPTFIITTLFAALYFHYTHLSFLNKALKGLNILLIPLFISALLSIGASAVMRRRGIDYRSIAIACICFVLYVFTKVGMETIIIVSGVLGIVLYMMTGFFNDKLHDFEVEKDALTLRKKAWLLLAFIILFFSASLFYLSHPLWILFSSFLRIGVFAFGGGIAAIPLMEEAFVRNLHWFTTQQFWDGIAISQVTPGPIFIDSAFFGYKVYGVLGSLVATIGMCIPSVVLIILVGKVHARFKHLAFVRSLTRGFLAGFIGILLGLIVSQIQRSLGTWQDVLLAVACLFIMKKVKNGLPLSIIFCLVYSLFIHS